MEFGIRNKAELRVSNLLQFYSMPSHKTDKEIKFKKVILRDEQLGGGVTGTREVSFVSELNQAQLEYDNKSTPGETEKI